MTHAVLGGQGAWFTLLRVVLYWDCILCPAYRSLFQAPLFLCFAFSAEWKSHTAQGQTHARLDAYRLTDSGVCFSQSLHKMIRCVLTHAPFTYYLACFVFWLLPIQTMNWILCAFWAYLASGRVSADMICTGMRNCKLCSSMHALQVGIKQKSKK